MYWLVILQWLGCAAATIIVVSLWAALVLNARVCGHPEDEPGDRLTQL
jgi:hypothetical protein